MLSPFFIQARYFFLIPLSILEGPILALLCGVGASLGYVNPFIAWAILVLGDVLSDIVYYWIGRWGATLPRVRAFATRTRLIRENLPSLEALWRERPLPAIASAKLAWGIAPPLIVSIGLSGMEFWKFLRYSLTVSIPYLGALVALGYGIAAGIGTTSGLFKQAPVYFGVAGLLCLIIFIVAARWVRERLPFSRMQKRSNIIGK